MSTELDISHLIGSDDFVPFDLSNNQATLGDNAGQLTWEAACEAANEMVSPLLNTEEKKQAFRDFVKSSGGWSEEEISAFTDSTLNALLLQWIAGDVREAFDDADPSEWDWAEYEEDAHAGRVSARLYKGDNGKIYFSISE